jgi:hypothetical protein
MRKIIIRANSHPVFDVHQKYKAEINNTGTISGIHVQNRLSIDGFLQNLVPHSLEVEGVFSILPKRITRSSNFYSNYKPELTRALRRHSLRKVLFQSYSAYCYQKFWVPELAIDKIEYINMVPPEIDLCSYILRSKRNVSNVLLVATSFHRRGLMFLDEVASQIGNLNFSVIYDGDEEFKSNNVKKIKIARMSNEIKRNIFRNSDIILNLSLGDTLGTFLDGVRFGIPVIGFPGQHGNTYQRPENIISSPLFEYDLFKKELVENIYESKLILDKAHLNYDFSQPIKSIIKRLQHYEKFSSEVKCDMSFYLANFSIEVWKNQMKKFLLDA